MSDLDYKIRRGLERLTAPDRSRDPLTFEDLVAAGRRRRRSRNVAVVALVAVGLLALVGGMLTLDSDRDRTGVVATGPDEIGVSEELDQDQAEAAASLVSEFLDDLRRDDLTAAAQRWSGYPELGSDAAPSERFPFLERLVADATFSTILRAETSTKTFVTASWARTSPDPVVTVLAPRTGEGPPVAVAFLTGPAEEHGDAGVLRIHRLPTVDLTARPAAAGSFVEPGQQVVIPGIPVEGGARAHIGIREIPVDIDHEGLTMTITVPDGIQGDVAVTISTATPELPSVQAFALTIRSTAGP